MGKLQIMLSNLPFVVLSVSVLALVIAFLNYRRKSSVSIRGTYILGSSSDCDQHYISSVILENMKDRAVTIYGIYFLVGYNFLIEIEDFEESPLILRPFETIRKTYGPIEFYGFNMRRVDMSQLLRRRDVRMRLVLSTNEGRYVVRQYPRRWSPFMEHFQNHAFAILKPIRTTYKENDIGGNIRYVVDIVLSNDKNHVMLLQLEDYKYKRFKDFRLTPESLASAEALNTFLAARQADGTLVCKSFKVFDAKEWREHKHEDYKRIVNAKYIGFFTYYFLSRFMTIRRDRALRRKNKRRAKEKKLNEQ